MTQIVKMDSRGRIYIPAEIRKLLDLVPGTEFKVRALHSTGTIVLYPENADEGQAWFWTAEWQDGEREADEDIAAGRTTSIESPSTLKETDQ